MTDQSSTAIMDNGGGAVIDRLSELRRYAERHNPDTERRWAQMADAPTETDRHLYDGGCPWCRADEVGPPHHPGNAHDSALFLLDEIERLQAAVCELVAEAENPRPLTHELGQAVDRALRSDQ